MTTKRTTRRSTKSSASKANQESKASHFFNLAVLKGDEEYSFAKGLPIYADELKSNSLEYQLLKAYERSKEAHSEWVADGKKGDEPVLEFNLKVVMRVHEVAEPEDADSEENDVESWNSF